MMKEYYKIFLPWYPINIKIFEARIKKKKNTLYINSPLEIQIDKDLDIHHDLTVL